MENILLSIPLPQSIAEAIYITIAILGGVLFVYSIFIEAEYKSDIIRLVGASSLVAYSVHVNELLLAIIFFTIAVASLVEAYEISTGRHARHGE